MKQKIKDCVTRICAKNARLASIYYAVFSSAMSYEHLSVLNGKLRFKKDSSAVVLRRNTHRLEKGLIMEPRRDVFALDYISQTVDAYCELVVREDQDLDSLAWSKDVLRKFFSVVKETPELVQVKDKFFKCLSEKCDGVFSKSPYERGNQQSPVSYDDLLSLSVLRRSVRWYEQKTVPRELIDNAINLARMSPSACNRQPFTLKIYDHKDMIDKVASLPGGTVGFSQNFPMIIAIVGQLRNYYSEADRHIIYIDASLFTMSFVLALESLGLSSCIINWPENLVKEQEANRILELSADERIIFFVSVGFADKRRQVPYSQKKSLDELRKYC